MTDVICCTHPDPVSLDAETEDAFYWYCPACNESGVL